MQEPIQEFYVTQRGIPYFGRWLELPVKHGSVNDGASDRSSTYHGSNGHRPSLPVKITPPAEPSWACFTFTPVTNLPSTVELTRRRHPNNGKA